MLTLLLMLYVVGAGIFGTAFIYSGSQWAPLKEGGFAEMSPAVKESKIIRVFTGVTHGLIWIIPVSAAIITAFSQRNK